MNEPDPFSDLIVKDPRSGETTVPGLNDRPLRHLLQQFARVDAGQTPRPLRPSDQAVLVVSEQPGYGKSHLVGRLFGELAGRATLVYVQPFQNSATAFQSLMLAVVREMHFPDRTTTGAWDRDAPSQLDHLAHAVLAHLLADLVEGRAPGIEVAAGTETAAHLRQDPLTSFDRGVDPWARWLQEHWTMLEPHFEEALAGRGLSLSQPGTWLRVLRAYAFAPRDFAARRTCLDWLTGQPLDKAEAEAVGLRASDTLSGEISPRESNALCRTRLLELCQLASFHRPLVLSFDQTEVYGHHPALARAFGLVLATIINEAPGTLLLITANQTPWLQKVAPYIEEADLQRIASPPLLLEGLNRAQAAELARLRLRAAGVDPARVEPFLAGPWMAELFPTDRNQMGPRLFLKLCQQRWSEAPTRDTTLEEHLEALRDELLRSPKRLTFNPDSLQWLVEEAAAGLPGVQVSPLAERYFSVQWTMAERVCLFGFISGSHWRQWRTVARISVERSRVGPVPTKCVCFRGPEDPPIPGPQWSMGDEIRAAMQESLQLVCLTAEEAALLYAARELFADAVQGDIAYTGDEVLRFLHTRLEAWWTRLRGPAVPQAEPVLASA